jgi:hypothetical protein
VGAVASSALFSSNINPNFKPEP